jgi:hypothetical protein
MNTSAKLDLSAIQEGEEYDIRFRESSDNTTGFVVEEIVRLLARQGESS